jgi:carboxymethylenebutenolidase
MCDEQSQLDIEAQNQRQGISRREFNAGLSVSALAAMLPNTANAAEVVEADVSITTPDGQADGYLVHPAKGKHAAVIMWPDIMGIRPAFRLMGKRLAAAGYTVLVVNPYYRTHQGEIISSGEGFHMPEVRERLMPHARSLSPATCVSDGQALVDYLDQHNAVDTNRKVGICGYCMTGSYSIRLAAAQPERIGAGASFHGGGLATDDDASPHLLLPKVKADLLIAIAENDDEKEPEAKETLRVASAAAGVNAEIEVYQGAMHGWCPLDSRAYNEPQAERAWSRMLALYARQLA